jgi:hypothetical protein
MAMRARTDIPEDISMIRTLISLVLALTCASAASAASPCTLDASVLTPYNLGAAATLEQWRASRAAVSRFIGCETVDASSRKVFYAVVEREFQTDHSTVLAQWAASRPGSEALLEGLTIYQSELRDFIERTFDSKRDAEFAPVVLKYGTGRTIASLGPTARDNVLRMLGAPHHPYGVSAQYNGQIEAMTAIGYWIEPGNTQFARAEKARLTAVATGLLAVSRQVRRGHHYRLVEMTLKTLAKSDDPQAEQAVRGWMASADPSSALYKVAARAADEIRKKVKASS